MKAGLPATLTKSVPRAMGALDAMKIELSSAATYERIKKIEREAEAIGILYAEVDRVRQRAQEVIAHANHRIGEELRAAPKATGGQPYRSVLPVTSRVQVETSERVATQSERIGSRKKASRLQKLAGIPLAVVEATVAEIHAKGKDATVPAIMKAIAGDETKAKREASRSAPLIADGMEMRIGDCREALITNARPAVCKRPSDTCATAASRAPIKSARSTS
jgi:hypothetical protein